MGGIGQYGIVQDAVHTLEFKMHLVEESYVVRRANLVLAGLGPADYVVLR